MKEKRQMHLQDQKHNLDLSKHCLQNDFFSHFINASAQLIILWITSSFNSDSIKCVSLKITHFASEGFGNLYTSLRVPEGQSRTTRQPIDHLFTFAHSQVKDDMK